VPLILLVAAHCVRMGAFNSIFKLRTSRNIMNTKKITITLFFNFLLCGCVTSIVMADQEGSSKDLSFIERFKNYSDFDKRSITIYYSDHGEAELVEKIISTGMSVNIFFKGNTPLNAAAIRGHLDTVKMLIEHGATLDLADQDKDTPLKNAARNGHIDVVRYLIKQCADVNAFGRHQTTPLTSAAYNGHKEIIELLLEHGADLTHETTKNHWGLLHYAAYHGHIDVAKFLIDKGINLNKESQDDWTALEMAVTENYPDVLKLLLDAGASQGKALYRFAKQGSLKRVKLLVESGGDINIPEPEYGTTPLTIAIKIGYTEIAYYLLEHGADVNSMNLKKWTPAHFAATYDQIDIMKVLIAKNAYVDKKHKKGWTPLLQAVDENHIEIVKLLIKSNANVNLGNRGRWTPIILAADEGYTKMVKLLIDNGADINHRNKDGNTALNLAMKHGHDEVVKILSSAGADPGPVLKKITYKTAHKTDTVEAYEEFLTRYPASKWRDKAIYYRDRAALNKAKLLGSSEAFQSFLDKYPGSDWGDQARYFKRHGVK